MTVSADYRGGAILVEPAGPADAGPVAALHADTFVRPWTESDVRALMRGPGGVGFVARQDGKAIGFLIGRMASDEAELISVGVLTGHRRLGVGRDLLDQFENSLVAKGIRSMFLEVDVANDAAVRLYRSKGFRQVGRRRLYYKAANGRRSDALVMRRAYDLEP